MKHSAPHPTAEHISTSKGIHGGFCITYLVNDTFEQLRYHGYTRAEAERLARRDARKLADQIFINVN